jgi:salicylate hydroxylase
VHYPLSGWKVFNLVVTYHNDAPEPVAGKPVAEEEVMQGFGHVHPRAQEIIRHGTNWRLWVLCDRDPVERWVDGRVALLGDAAHPMLPHLGQGANQSIEDGMALATILAQAHAAAVPAALQAYERLRRERVAEVQLGARQHGLRVDSAYADLALRDAELAAHADFRRQLYSYDVVTHAKAAAAALRG